MEFKVVLLAFNGVLRGSMEADSLSIVDSLRFIGRSDLEFSTWNFVATGGEVDLLVRGICEIGKICEILFGVKSKVFVVIAHYFDHFVSFDFFRNVDRGLLFAGCTKTWPLTAALLVIIFRRNDRGGRQLCGSCCSWGIFLSSCISSENAGS